MRSASAGRIIFAPCRESAAASFFMLTSLSEGTTTQTGLPSTPGHQRLQHVLRRNAERLRCLQADASASGIVVVGMQGERGAELAQRLRGVGGFRHGVLKQW